MYYGSTYTLLYTVPHTILYLNDMDLYVSIIIMNHPAETAAIPSSLSGSLSLKAFATSRFHLLTCFFLLPLPFFFLLGRGEVGRKWSLSLVIVGSS